MSLNTQTFTDLVQNSVIAIQAASRSFQDLTIGSILRAVMEANAAAVLWMQSLIVQLLATTRAATSSGADLVSWMNDYNFQPIAAFAATGFVTFSRFTPTAQAVVPIGAQIQDAAGNNSFIVTLDTTNSAYSSMLGGYVLAAGTASITVPIQSIKAGAASNLLANTINTINTPISGVDTVTNAVALTNGMDAESDPAMCVRFWAYIASLSKATKGAIGYAITSLQPGMTYTIIENYLYNGTYQPGNFALIVDDGTGTPSGTLLSTVYAAVDMVRGDTITFSVNAPVVTTANVSMTISTATGYTHSAVVALVVSALTNYINAMTLGQDLYYTKLAQLAYDASPGVYNVSGVTLNSGTADLIVDSLHVIKSGTLSIA
jgi:uncharacterized phage protein gp47/JayE